RAAHGVAQERGALDAERVERGEDGLHLRRRVVAEVARRRAVALAETEEIQGDDVVPARELRDDVAPGPVRDQVAAKQHARSPAASWVVEDPLPADVEEAAGKAHALHDNKEAP